MGTSASLSKAEPPCSSSKGFSDSGENHHIQSLKIHHPENISHLNSDQQYNEYMRALNTIQRQQEDLEELTQQLQQRDQDLRLIKDLRTREEPATLDESLRLRDLRIRKLEEDADRAKQDLAKQKGRYKRKTRDILTQLAEAKQSSTIRIMELRQEVHRINLENRQLKERLGLSDTALVASSQQRTGALSQTGTATAAAAAAAVANSTDAASGQLADIGGSANKSLIVELSTQLNEQADQLSSLRRRLAERDARIAQMESASSTATAAAKTVAAGKHEGRPGVTNGGPIVKRSLYSGQQQQQQQQHQNPPPAGVKKFQTATSDELSIQSSLISGITGNDDEDDDDDRTEMDDDEPGTNRSFQYYAGDADSIYSEDTLLFVEMQQQQGQAGAVRSAAGHGSGAGATIIFDAYKQRTIDKLLQD